MRYNLGPRGQQFESAHPDQEEGEMTAPSEDQKRVPPYVALVRIAAVVSMSTAAAFGILLLIGEFWLEGLIAFLLTVPCFLVMRLVERIAEPPEPPPST